MVLPNFFLQLFQTQETPPKQTFGELPDSEKGGGVLQFCEHAQKCLQVSLSCVRKSLCVLSVCERFST